MNILAVNYLFKLSSGFGVEHKSLYKTASQASTCSNFVPFTTILRFPSWISRVVNFPPEQNGTGVGRTSATTCDKIISSGCAGPSTFFASLNSESARNFRAKDPEIIHIGNKAAHFTTSRTQPSAALAY